MWIVQKSLDQLGEAYEYLGSGPFHEAGFENGIKLLREIDADTGERYICKGHWGEAGERDALLSVENIKIFLIWREIRDALVSQYYFNMRHHKRPYRDFDEFYWRHGRPYLLKNQVEYRRVWGEADDPRIVHTSYTRLKTDFDGEASRLLAAAGIRGVDMEDLKRRLSLDRLRKEINDAEGVMIRKGALGEHREVIRSEEILRDINEVEKTISREPVIPLR
ncbi:MAG: sulfotransferase domain-containing protein [Candidatus Nitrospinota bacterium M3_3B_026]